MAAIRLKQVSGAGLSCLDMLAASGYVWGATDSEASESRVACDEIARGFDALNVMPLCMVTRR